MKRITTLFVLAFSLLAGACTQIDTGNVGVESTMGQVKSEIMQPGVYFSLFKHVKEVVAKEAPVSIEDMKPQTADKITLQDVDVDIYVQINSAKAAMIMTKWPGDVTSVAGEEGERVGFNYVARQAREAIYSAVATHQSATVHTERSQLAAEVVKALQKSLDEEAGKDLFYVRSANVRNLVTDPALEANIKAAAQAQFKLQEERNLQEVTKVQAERKRIEAQGEADAIRIKAEAVAKQGGAEYVQLQAIQKWNGTLPTYTGNTLPFLQVK